MKFKFDCVNNRLSQIGEEYNYEISKEQQFTTKYLELGFILDPNNPTIHLRVSGDGRNVGRQVKHVMVTCAIMNDINCLQKPDSHHTIVLYPGTENYIMLQIALNSLFRELQHLKETEFQDQTGIT